MQKSNLYTTKSQRAKQAANSISNSPNTKLVPCPTHPQYSITNICKDPKCIQPLCPECIPYHIELHQSTKNTPNIQNIMSTRLKCIQEMNILKYETQQKLSEFISDNLSKIVEQMRRQVQRVRKMKLEIMKVVNDYFDRITGEIQKMGMVFKNLQQKQRKKNLMRISPLRQYIKKLQINKQQLQSDQYIPTLLQLLNDPPILPKIQNIPTNKQIKFIQANYNYLQQIRLNLQKHIKVAVKIDNESGLEKCRQNNLKFSRFDRSRSKDKIFNSVQQTLLKQGSNKIKYESISQNLKLYEFVLHDKVVKLNAIKNNYFPKIHSTNIVTFQQGTKNCYVAEVSHLETGFKKTNLNIQNNIPFSHQTIILPGGQTFLLGGHHVDQNNGKIVYDNKVFQYSQGMLHQISPMNISRSRFGACYNNFGIYCCGGLTGQKDVYKTFQITNSFQFYDLNIKKWTQLAPIKQKSYDFCLCPLSHNKICKFGGTLENCQRLNVIDIYEIKGNYWSRVFTKDFYLPIKPGIINISDSQILIFGGMNSAKKKYNSCFIISFRDNGKVKANLAIQLYNQATFQNTFIVDNKVVSIQDGDQGKSKILMSFQNNKWKFLSC